MSGLPKGEVFLCDDTVEWAVAFDEESNKILDAVEPYVGGIHHIGSTAVPGLKAKPVIDIAIELYRFEDGFQCIEPLTGIGYKHRVLAELPERHYFSKGVPRTHQIHMFKPGSPYLREQLAFRDKLRSDGDLAKKYSDMKLKLTETYRHDKPAYTDAKTDFIKSVVSVA